MRARFIISDVRKGSSMSFLVTFGAALHLLVMTPLCAFAALIASFVDRKGFIWWPISRFWGLTVLWLVTRRALVRGLDKVNAENGAILMANHTSHLDPPLIIAINKIPIRFLTKKILFYFPFFGWALWMTGHIPINRSDRSSAFSSLDRAAELISTGRLVAIFPEGTRSDTKELHPFKKGGFVLAVKGKIPIIPVGIAGTQEAMPKGWCWMKRGSVRVVFGEPIDTSGYTLETKEELMERVRTRMLEHRDEAESWKENA
jgi:1-acyl-sn-glycerol-3-phosphate acyltransferase